jgi:aspartyl-tRNA(Asn)/glutamyl-tRNA(Gln) amidotransferase subunit B
MEEGSLRRDANISVRPVGSDGLGTKTELKNMNSFRHERGIRAEVASAGKRCRAGAGRWSRRHCISIPSPNGSPAAPKEEAHDYRYFPSPTRPGGDHARMLDAARATCLAARRPR